MKNIITVLALSLIFSFSARAEGGVIYRGNCTVIDESKDIEEGKVGQKFVELKNDDSVEIANHEGISYQIWAADMSDSSDSAPRIQVGLVMQEVASGNVLGQTGLVFSLEAPSDLFLNLGVLPSLSCMTADAN